MNTRKGSYWARLVAFLVPRLTMNPRRITLGQEPALPPRIQRVLDRVICILHATEEVALAR
jgi:hypothetical protein